MNPGSTKDTGDKLVSFPIRVTENKLWTRSPGTTSVCFSAVTVNDKHRKPEFKIRVGVKFKEVSGLKAIYGLQLYLKETSTNVFSCQYCKMFW